MPIFYVLEVQNVRQIVNSIQGVYDVAVLKTATHIDLHTRHTACFLCLTFLKIFINKKDLQAKEINISHS